MTGKLAVASLILAMTCRAAIADAVDECVPSNPSAVIQLLHLDARYRDICTQVLSDRIENLGSL